MEMDPATKIQDYWVFGEYGGVNPSIEDASTFTFLSAEKMQELFQHEVEGCYLYSRHLNPTVHYLAQALALLEATECAHITASGMAAISCAILEICNCGDNIVSSRTIYGGTYALFKNFLPRLGIETTFVDITDLDAVKKSISTKTKIIYTESLSNPLLEVADIPNLSQIAREYGLLLVVDNTFSPMIITPAKYGADIIVHSLTKFINGASDCIAGGICGTREFIASLKDVHNGSAMLLGPTLDSIRAASIFKNLHTLHIRIKQHSKNAQFIAEKLQELGLRVFYPGLPDHPQHKLMKELMNEEFGFGGMVTFDCGTPEKANELMLKMQENKVGYFAVSLGFYKTLFSAPGLSTSSEIPPEEQQRIGLSPGLVRMSVGLDNDIEVAWERINKSLREVGLV
ncbi:MAG: aminotransferase class I/II-fold pyridoxal phosphate-dependent enzyme [Ignavibacteria bacterium]|nr:aminotransferase class I/II-fold pyridoxal phosphate-dependent enzyme [Ignavibacteria bacterium]